MSERLPTSPRPIPDRGVRWHGYGPVWRRLTPSYRRGKRLALVHARELARDPDAQSRIDESIHRIEAGESRPVDTLALLNDYRVQFRLRDPNPFPRIRLFRWPRLGPRRHR